MRLLEQYLIPYVLSNTVFGLTVVAAWKKPMWARLFLAVSFLVASVLNARTAMTTPGVYLQYGELALWSSYRNFIYGFFSDHVSDIIMAVATSQFLICIGLVLNKKWNKAACIGGIVFGLGIAGLGVGSAFPATVLMSVAFFILLTRPEHDFIWIWRQYENRIVYAIGNSGKVSHA